VKGGGHSFVGEDTGAVAVPRILVTGPVELDGAPFNGWTVLARGPVDGSFTLNVHVVCAGNSA
jgi:hypothetical protein